MFARSGFPFWGAGKSAIFGDSGNAVRVGTGLAAAGDLTHVVVDTRRLPSYIAGTTIQKMLSISGSGWTLVLEPALRLGGKPLDQAADLLRRRHVPDGERADDDGSVAEQLPEQRLIDLDRVDGL
jgi:hypothetical protein